ncbi:hypothetical protein AB0D86_10230 [Streptomyces sp. NPDC048324]|uniref:hypothetical protein n=1 Tax=Streptomyces sp. NPDC048324 TaxID=3157205 RepID=UPI003434720A
MRDPGDGERARRPRDPPPHGGGQVIGNLYLTTAFSFFLLGGVLALLMRAELACPGLQLVTQERCSWRISRPPRTSKLMSRVERYASDMRTPSSGRYEPS